MSPEKPKNKRLRIVQSPPTEPVSEESKTAADCPHCFGTGMEPVPDDKRLMRRCRCQTQDHGERLSRAARIPPRYQHCTLANYEAGDTELSKWVAKAESQRILDDYPVLEGRGVVFVGAVGVGKTHLAVAI